MDTKRLYPKILNYLAITVAAIWYAFTYYLFIINNNFAPAGFDGIATMIQYKTGFSIGYFSLIINIPLCVLAFFLVDKSFAKRTLFFCIVYSVWYIILQKVGFTDFQYRLFVNSWGKELK